MTTRSVRLREIAKIDDEACQKFQAGIELVGKRWTASIMLAAARGAERFSDYYRQVDGISERLLALRLKELTQQHLLERTVIPSTPVQIKYTLTEGGRELLIGLAPLIRWGQKWEGVLNSDQS